jgi:hypothetical protein
VQSDELELEAILEEIGVELRKHPGNCVYDEEDKETRLFSKEFLILVNDISQKYQLIAS